MVDQPKPKKRDYAEAKADVDTWPEGPRKETAKALLNTIKEIDALQAEYAGMHEFLR